MSRRRITEGLEHQGEPWWPLAEVMSEEDLQRHVVGAAEDLGWLVLSTRRSIHSPSSDPDLRLIRPPRLIYVELKDQAGKPRPSRISVRTGRHELGQAEVLELLRRCPGVEAYLWRPSDWLTDEVLRVLAR